MNGTLGRKKKTSIYMYYCKGMYMYMYIQCMHASRYLCYVICQLHCRESSITKGFVG